MLAMMAVALESPLHQSRPAMTTGGVELARSDVGGPKAPAAMWTAAHVVARLTAGHRDRPGMAKHAHAWPACQRWHRDTMTATT